MSVEGRLDIFQLSEILQVISQQRKTGILTVQGEDDIVAISFLNGQIVTADSLNETREERLEAVLLAERYLDSDTLAEVAEASRKGEGTLLELLVEHRHLDRDQLLKALRLQTFQLLLQLLSWRKGEFKFYATDEVAYEEGFEVISVEDLLLRSIEEETGAPAPSLEAVYERLQTGQRVEVKGEQDDMTRTSEEGIWLTPAEKDVLDRIDGRSSVADIVEQTAAEGHQVRYAMFRLAQLGLVRPATRETEAEMEPAEEVPSPAVPEAPPPEPPPSLREAPAAPPRAEVTPVPEPPRRRRRPTYRGVAWLSGLLAVALVAALGKTLVAAPDQLPFPFPWQEAGRAEFSRQQRGSLYGKIDRAAKTYFLLEVSFPEDLEPLLGWKLLAPPDLNGPQGRRVHYQAGDLTYELQPVGDGAGRPEVGGVTGNFLLDPQFFQTVETPETQPLVLVD